jgi:hypothetical protein
MYSKEEIMSIIESEGNTHSFTYRGINCSMKRNSLLVWCGYMDVPEEVIMEIYVHGGITYDNIEENGLRRYGFDCGHLHDLVPYTLELDSFPRASFVDTDIYRTKTYAILETKGMVDQVMDTQWALKIIRNYKLSNLL